MTAKKIPVTCPRCNETRLVNKLRGPLCRPCVGVLHSIKLKGHKVSPETREKIRQANTGHVPTAEARANLSAALKGRVVSAETRRKIAVGRMGEANWARREEVRAKISAASRGRPSPWSKRPRSLAERAKISATKRANGDSVGPRNPMYRDGGSSKDCPICNKQFFVPTSTKDYRRFCSRLCKGAYMRLAFKGNVSNKHLRNRREYFQFRDAVLERDEFTCQMCGLSLDTSPDIILHVDHIKPVITHPELIYDVTNGRCLCRPCHYTLPTHGGNARQWASRLV